MKPAPLPYTSRREPRARRLRFPGGRLDGNVERGAAASTLAFPRGHEPLAMSLAA